MKIDWNVAPDWAIGHAIHATAMGVKEVWVGEDKYQQFDHSRPFPYGGTVGADSYHNPRRNQFAFETLRPAPWTGEGLPPVGTVCRIVKIDGIDAPLDTECKIVAHEMNGDNPVAVYLHGKAYALFVGIGIQECFHPIRTPEQIAAEERPAAAYGMCAVVPTLTNVDAVALYDAGYRKQV